MFLINFSHKYPGRFLLFLGHVGKYIIKDQTFCFYKRFMRLWDTNVEIFEKGFLSDTNITSKCISHKSLCEGSQV